MRLVADAGNGREAVEMFRSIILITLRTCAAREDGIQQRR